MKSKTCRVLTPDMRRRLKRALDSGKKTPEDIRHNMAELHFIEQNSNTNSIYEGKQMDLEIECFLIKWERKNRK